MSIVTASPKLQVVIPRRIREALKLEPGQKVMAFEYDERAEFIEAAALNAVALTQQGTVVDLSAPLALSAAAL